VLGCAAKSKSRRAIEEIPLGVQVTNEIGEVDNARRTVILGGAAMIGLASSRMTIGSQLQFGVYDGTIAVNGNSLINGAGEVIQLRGSNIQAHALAMIKGNADASGGGVDGPNDAPKGPNLAFLKKWKMNAIRIGINEASWLGYQCYSTGVNGNGATGWIKQVPNTGPNSYQQQITQQIASLNSIGCYVTLTLAATNPGRSAPGGQDFMANQDNSINCWESIAATYGYPHGTALKRNGGTVDDRSVVFELFNEPEMYGDSRSSWSLLMNGGFAEQSYTTNGYGAFADIPSRPVYPYPCTTPAGTFIPGENAVIDGAVVGVILCYYKNTTRDLPASGSQFIHLFTPAGYSGHPPTVSQGNTITGSISRATTQVTGGYGWYVAGHSQMLAGIRAAGAWNVCLLSGDQYNQDLSGWAAYAPSDSKAPAGYSGSGWKPQIGACWHPYPSYSYVSNAVVAGGGSGYAVGDTILLPMPESGSAANSVYWQAQLRVTGVNGGAVTAVQINPYTGGKPGKAGGNPGQFTSHSSGGSPVGGAYSNLLLPANPIPQFSSSGKGTGATFNLSFTSVSGTGWPNALHWPAVAALKTKPGVPVVITETGEHYGTGISGSPWMTALTSWCDTNGISLVAYAYTPSNGWTDLNGGDFSLVDGDHNPTPGYGTFMYNWFTTHSP
jgi:hypothetical protein